MKDIELFQIWESYHQKIDKVVTLNKDIAYSITKEKLNKTINSTKNPKRFALLIGIPYTFLLYAITFIAIIAKGYFTVIGFGTIALIMTVITGIYIYHLYLINQINKSDDVVSVQQKLSKLKISSFNSARVAVLQFPFWSICWININALKSDPFVYGGVNLIVFLAFCFFSVWLYKNISIKNANSKVSKFFLSGVEWTPLIKATEILDQLKEYEE